MIMFLVPLSINIQLKYILQKNNSYLCIIQNIQKSELKTLETRYDAGQFYFWENSWLKDKKFFSKILNLLRYKKSSL